MTDYPEWLVDRVAKAMAETFFDDDEFGWDNMSQAAIALWRRDAGRVLDTLGFHQATTPQNWESALQREES